MQEKEKELKPTLAEEIAAEQILESLKGNLQKEYPKVLEDL
ncbi:hypothetical protein [Leptospira ognonensis]|nr:hypothetical protein [Leptospira ognonensis]